MPSGQSCSWLQTSREVYGAPNSHTHAHVTSAIAQARCSAACRHICGQVAAHEGATLEKGQPQNTPTSASALAEHDSSSCWAWSQPLDSVASPHVVKFLQFHKLVKCASSALSLALRQFSSQQTCFCGPPCPPDPTPYSNNGLEQCLQVRALLAQGVQLLEQAGEQPLTRNSNYRRCKDSLRAELQLRHSLSACVIVVRSEVQARSSDAGVLLQVWLGLVRSVRLRGCTGADWRKNSKLPPSVESGPSEIWLALAQVFRNKIQECVPCA